MRLALLFLYKLRAVHSDMSHDRGGGRRLRPLGTLLSGVSINGADGVGRCSCIEHDSGAPKIQQTDEEWRELEDAAVTVISAGFSNVSLGGSGPRD